MAEATTAPVRVPGEMREPSELSRRRFLAVAGLGALSAGTLAALDPSRGVASPRFVGQPLTWRPPQLHRPTTIDVNRSWLSLDADRDYILRLPRLHPLRIPGGVQINGGRNVVMIGGSIRIPRLSSPSASELRGLMVSGSTGTVHIEGVRIAPLAGAICNEGIDIAAPHAVVQIQNCRIGPITRPDIQHNDIVQTWGGVRELRIDHLTGLSNYQGLTLKGDNGTTMRNAIIRNVNIDATNIPPNYQQYLWFEPGTGTGAALTDEVYLNLPSFQALRSAVWPQWNSTSAPCTVLSNGWLQLPAKAKLVGIVKPGKPVGGDFVPGGRAGVGYISPGYLKSPAAPIEAARRQAARI